MPGFFYRCAGIFLGAANRAFSLVVVRWLLIAAVSLVVEQGSWARGLSVCSF